MLTARRMNIGGVDYYEISGKLTYDTWSATWNRLKPIGTIEELTFEMADDTLELFSDTTKAMTGVSIRSIAVRDFMSSFEMYIDGQSRTYNGWRGFFRARVPVGMHPAMDAENMAQLFRRVGLDDLLLDPTPQDELNLRKSRLIWQHAPKRIADTQGLTDDALTVKLDAILEEEGIDPGRAAGLKYQEVFEGYLTLVDEAAGAEYKKAGLKYVWSGVLEAEDVVKIVKTGLISNNNRFISGMPKAGASPESDFRGGGSDSVFTRLGVRAKDNPQFSSCFLGKNYRILIDPIVMNRTDWYAYTFDNFGSAEVLELQTRPTPVQFIKDMQTSYRFGNEIMFRRGIAKETFTGISCQTSALRAELLQLFKDEHITAVNGIPIDQFVKEGTDI